VGSAPQVLTIQSLEAETGLVHGFSTTSLGSMGLTHAPDPEAVMASRRHFARTLGIDAEPLTVAGAVHGNGVARVDEHVDVVKGVDALVTDRRGVALFATFADCYPIVLWDAEHRCAALVHAGWRGTKARVVPGALEKLHDEYGTNPAHVKAGIGPGICGRCYEVGEEVASQFDARFVRRGGVTEVDVIGLCTKETDYLPSHRRSPDGTRFGAIVALR
jgi:YfiH family protein